MLKLEIQKQKEKDIIVQNSVEGKDDNKSSVNIEIDVKSDDNIPRPGRPSKKNS